MRLNILIVRPEIPLNIKDEEILLCNSKEDLLEMLRDKVKTVVSDPKYFRIDPKALMGIVAFWQHHKGTIIEYEE